MNIYTSNPPSKKHAHRHFVVAPLAALLAVLSLVPSTGLSTVQASVEPLQVFEDDRMVWVSPAAIGMRMDAKTGQTDGGLLLVEEGTVLVQTEGGAELQAGDYRITSMPGAFSVSRFGAQITVAALTTPVLVAGPEGVTVVPVNMQWQSTVLQPRAGRDWETWMQQRSLRTLPVAFRKEMFLHLQEMPEPAFALPDSRSEPPRTHIFDALLLTAAIDRQEQEWTEQVIGHVRFLMEADDAAALEHFLSDTDVRRVFAEQPAAQRILVLLLHRAPVSVLSTLLAQVTDERARLLLSLHPQFAPFLWHTETSVLEERDHEALRLLLLPQSDTSGNAFPASVIDRWQEDLQAFVSADEDGDAFFAELISALTIFLDRTEQEHPSRVRVYAKSLLAIVSQQETQNDPALQQHVSALERLAAALPEVVESTQIPDASASSASLPSAEEAPAFDAAEVVRQARSLVTQAGALFTVRTQIEALDARTARVRDISFSDGKQDSIYTFDIDLEVMRAQSIARDGTVQLYPLGWKEFVHWVTGND